VIDAALGEILTTCSKLEWLLKHGEAALRPETRHTNLMLAYKKSVVHYEPLGVVAAIVSWNYRSYYSLVGFRLSLTYLQHFIMRGHQSLHPSSRATEL
jgi:acyl-CoA reductase-like NAD-dependent aldehyde dehydrogenase